MPFNDRLFVLLSELEDQELEGIWAQALRCKPDYNDYASGSRDWRVACISAEWRAVHGHTLRNRLRSPHELPWKRILVDVADKLNPGWFWTGYRLGDNTREEEIEADILRMYDERARKMWENMPTEKRKELAQALNNELKAVSSEMGRVSKGIAARSVTVTSLGNGISAGLLTGGGALMLAQGAATTYFAGLVGGGVLAQLGLWITVRILGKWAGLKLVLTGGAAQIGARFVYWPLAVVMTADLFMQTSYRKSIPATLILLSSHELRRQIAALGE